MLFGLFLLALISGEEDFISTAVENYKSVESYMVTLVSKGGGKEEVIRYFYRKPGFVRMEFVKPHKGAVLVYDPVEKAAVLRPFGFLKPFVLRLGPRNRLIRSSRGHTVDRSDIGALLENVERIKKNGKIEVFGAETTGGREAVKVGVVARGGFTSDGVNSYMLWLEKRSAMPLRVIAFDAEGGIYEEVLMEDLELNPSFPDGFFEDR